MEELINNQISQEAARPEKAGRRIGWRDLLVIILAGIFGFLGGLTAQIWLPIEVLEDEIPSLVIERQPEVIHQETIHYVPQTTHEERVIESANQALPGVVSVVVTREVAVDPFLYGWGWFYQPVEPSVRQEVSHGTGFFISADGLILTNKHVVVDEDADYQVVTIDNETYPAQVLVRDPLHDLALMKVEGDDFPVLELGDSDQLVPGQTVLAIGNALGQFEGTVSTGIISGLSRMVSAYGFGYSDVLTDLIQTDAAINHGNSGGPLLDLNGQVVGVNVAMAEQAQNVGFAIPINQAKRAIKSFQETGRIVYPFLGISYVMVDQDIQEEHQLDYDYGALIIQDPQSGVSVMSGSTAEAMGLREGDVILEFNGQKVTADQMLGRIIQEYDPGDQIILKVWRQGQILTLEGSLGQREG